MAAGASEDQEGGGGGGGDGWKIAASPQGRAAPAPPVGPQEVPDDLGSGSSVDGEVEPESEAVEAAPVPPPPQPPAVALTQERDALRAILQDKVMAIVGEVEKSVGELGPVAREHPRLGRQLQYLQKLVEATVTAMEKPPAAVA